MKNLLIVNTLPKFASEAQSAIQMMQDKMPEVQVIHACEKNLRPCIGTGRSCE